MKYITVSLRYLFTASLNVCSHDHGHSHEPQNRETVANKLTNHKTINLLQEIINMRIQSLILSLFLFAFPLTAIAGSEHGHSHAPVTQAQAEMTASQILLKLSQAEKIDSSWKASTKVEKSQKKNFGGSDEWVVSFTNKNISDTSKQTLYIFLTLSGEYLAANYTGE